MSAPSPPAGAAPEPAPVQLMEFFCYECESTVSLPVAAAHPMARRPPCPLCRGNFLEPGPSPFPDLDPPPPPPPEFDLDPPPPPPPEFDMDPPPPPPPEFDMDPPPPPPPEFDLDPPPPPPLPAFLSGSEDSEGPVDFDELDDIEMMDPAEARFYIARFIQDRLYDVAAPDDIAAATAAAMSLLDDHIPGREPPAPAASIAVLPTVDVTDPAAACAVCREDLPVTSAALKLPCSHLYHSCCIVPWLQMHNSCPMCRSRLPVADPVEASPSERDQQTTITIRLTTTTRRRVRVNDGAVFSEAPVSESPTQLAQAVTGGGPANSGETVSSEWPPQPESDTVMSEAHDGDGFFD